MTTTNETPNRKQAIAILKATDLDETIGLGKYTDSAAYKLASGDIDANTPGLTEQLRQAIRVVGSINWDEAE